jgi:hypothetical protein
VALSSAAIVGSIPVRPSHASAPTMLFIQVARSLRSETDPRSATKPIRWLGF